MLSKIHKELLRLKSKTMTPIKMSPSPSQTPQVTVSLWKHAPPYKLPGKCKLKQQVIITQLLGRPKSRSLVRVWKWRSSHSLLVGMQKVDGDPEPVGPNTPPGCSGISAGLSWFSARLYLRYFHGFCPQVSFALLLVLIIAEDWSIWSVILKYTISFPHYFPNKVPIIYAIQGPSLPAPNLPFLSPFMLPWVWTKSLPKSPFLTSEPCSCRVPLLESSLLITT